MNKRLQILSLGLLIPLSVASASFINTSMDVSLINFKAKEPHPDKLKIKNQISDTTSFDVVSSRYSPNKGLNLLELRKDLATDKKFVFLTDTAAKFKTEESLIFTRLGEASLSERKFYPTSLKTTKAKPNLGLEAGVDEVQVSSKVDSQSSLGRQKESTKASSSKWTLVFSDEFRNGKLDLTKWRPYGPWAQGGDTQNYMMQDEVSVSNGILRMRASKRNQGGRPYTSGGVDTHFSFQQTYGKWEIRARVPSGVGLLPYAGIFPTTDVWPPEIDIVEVLGRKPNEVVMTNHWGVWPEHYYNAVHYQGVDFSQDFHRYTVEWYPDRIRWLVDGKERHVSTQGLHSMPSKFAMALGVWNCGSWADCPNSTVAFPKYFDVDYVRIYKLK